MPGSLQKIVKLSFKTKEASLEFNLDMVKPEDRYFHLQLEKQNIETNNSAFKLL